MKFLCGLALALIFFEGLISQCECKGHPSTSMVRTEKQQFNLTEIKETLFGRNGKLPKPNPNMEKILEDFIIQISPRAGKDDVEVKTEDGKNYLIILSAERLLLLLQNFGYLIKKIQFNYEEFDYEDFGTRSKILRAIATNCTEQLTELTLISKRRLFLFLDDMSKESRRKVYFPHVKKLVYRGVDARTHDFDWKTVFPNVEALQIEEFWGNKECCKDLDGFYDNMETSKRKKGCSIQ